jgi:type II secretory pathway pseudopilin PulG
MLRSAKGGTIIEMLVTTVVMSILALAFMGILLVNFKTNAKIDNMQDTINAVRMVKERIGRDVRMGRSIGDVYGAQYVDPATGMQFVQGSDLFPSTQDPVYGNAAPPTPTGWSSPPWRLGNQCLIVQIPILDNHNDTTTRHQVDPNKMGWPTMIPAGQGSPPPATNQDNVETHVYMIVPDANNPGEYLLQYCAFAGYPVAGYNPGAHNTLANSNGSAQTLLTGIIGPLDSAGNPKVFQFVSKTNSNGTPDDSILPTPQCSPDYTGVVVNLEVKRHQTTVKTRRDISLTPIGMKLEVFLRNNALATSTGQPSNINSQASP